MGYKLKMLSPVHIGCGESYNAVSYLLDKRHKPECLAVFDERAIFDVLDAKQKVQFVKWVESEERPNLFNFMRNEIRDENFKLSNQIQKKANYVIPNLAGNERLRDINAFIKQMKSPFIPGTEIKGAMRTAVLYCAVKDDVSIRNWIEDAFEKMLNEPAEKKQDKVIVKYRDYIQAVKNQKKPDIYKKNKLVKRLESIESQLQDKILNSKQKKPDAKYDVLKFLQVGDSVLLEATSALAVSYVKLYNMSGKSSPIFYEYLRPGILVSLTSFKLEDDISRLRKLNQMEFTERHKQLMSGLNPILSCCHRFTVDLIEEEIAYFTKHDKMNIVEHLQKIQKLNTPQAPVLRIGKDEGYTSLTVGLAVKKLMPELYENVLIHATKNKSYDSSITGDNFYFPKSRKIVHWDGQELTAGWVQLVSDEIQKPGFNPQKLKNESTQNKPGAPVDFSGLSDKFGKRKR